MDVPAVSINAAPLDGQIWGHVARVLLDPDVIAAEVERRRSHSTVACDLKAIAQRIATIDRQRQNLIRSIALFEDDQDSAALIAKELTGLSVQRKELDAEHRSKASLQAEETDDYRRLVDLAAWCARAAANLDQLSHQERRTILEALGVQVRVWKTDHEPRWEMELAPLPVEADPSIVFRTPRD